MESTFVMIKPDGVKRNLIGKIISKIENKGYIIDGMKMGLLSKELAERHYQEHKEQDWYLPLIDFITSGKIIAMKVSGPDVVNNIRIMSKIIREEFSHSESENVIHTSDSTESALRELDNFF